MAVYKLFTSGRMFTLNGVRSFLTSRILVKYQSDYAGNQEARKESSQKDTEEEYEENTKKKILTASMKFVHELGWSRQAISAGAESIGYPGVIHGMFPNGGAELVLHFYSTCNEKLNKIMQEEHEAAQIVLNRGRKYVHISIYNAIETRLRMIIPYKKVWPQAIALMSLPPNTIMSLAHLLTLIDDICYYTGDRSIDIQWYTKRLLLAGIYNSTEMYMLQDNSADHKETWEFLKRRIQDASMIQKVLTSTSDLPRPEETLKQVTDIATATFTTARNILGLNRSK